jgi:hypothetical protein
VCVYISTHETLLNTARERERMQPSLSLLFLIHFLYFCFTCSGKGDTRENGRVASPLSVSSNPVRQTDQRPYYSDHFL